MRSNGLVVTLAPPIIGIAIATVVVVMLWAILRHTPPAKRTIGVMATDGYGEPTKAAMEIWNASVGCKFLIPGDDIMVLSDNGAPCGSPWRQETEWAHAATAYKCPGGTSEILISSPGNSNTQACIILHELGHTLGRPHQKTGAMADNCKTDVQNVLLISDSDVTTLKKEFCR